MNPLITAGLAQTGDVPPEVLTICVEEEFLLVDPVTGRNVPVAGRVRAALGDKRPVTHPSVAGTVTGDCTGLREARHRLIALRLRAADAAADEGARLVAIGATPVADCEPEEPAGMRGRAVVERFGPVALDPALCGMHVRVGVPDRDQAIQVCNHLRIWLPVIQALTGNSPLFQGDDTGYSSWRSMQVRRWPGVAPTPVFRDAAGYDRAVNDLVTAGIVFDEPMVGWYARLEPSGAAVEVRAADVCTDVDDAVLVTALIRAAVATALSDTADGRPAPEPLDCVVAGAHWRAGRDGLDSNLVDLRLGRSRPAWELVDEFFATVSPALLHTGDLTLVVDGLARLRESGNGAARQRRLHDRTGDLPATLAEVADRTCAG